MKTTIFTGKTHFKWPCSMWSYQKVKQNYLPWLVAVQPPPKPCFSWCCQATKVGRGSMATTWHYKNSHVTTIWYCTWAFEAGKLELSKKNPPQSLVSTCYYYTEPNTERERCCTCSNHFWNQENGQSCPIRSVYKSTPSKQHPRTLPWFPALVGW